VRNAIWRRHQGHVVAISVPAVIKTLSAFSNKSAMVGNRF